MGIILGTQYYRPPFPEQRFWDDDFARIADAGLDTVQLWVVWSWVEAVPGRYEFGDYEALLAAAERHGLGVVLSTIADIHPYWLSREEPGSELVTNLGHRVVSCNRWEMHFGLAPGGCFDHPGVWRRMQAFLRITAERLRGFVAVRAWDAWNELRWNVNTDGPVCYCPHTLGAFRADLKERFGTLETLNAAWKRRYGNWEEILPGKTPKRPYTEMTAFTSFLTRRATRHAIARYETLKAVDPARPVTVHGGSPSPYYGWGGDNQPLNRGNDWHMADRLDGVGTSSFPAWHNMDDADFDMRVEFVKSAAGAKRVWLSELQGGRAAQGIEVHRPVKPLEQQRWIWNGLACGADAILFWSWRDEVFGPETAGYGIVGRDGLADARVAALRATMTAVRRHEPLLAAYKPAAPRVGVLFSPRSYYLDHAQSGTAEAAKAGLLGCCRALVRRSIPYVVVEEEHLAALEGLRILFLPRTHVVYPAMAEALEAFVRQGGTLVAESEWGAFDEHGLYLESEERFGARLAGFVEVGRRMLPSPAVLPAVLDGAACTLEAAQWLTPFTAEGAEVFLGDDEGALLAARSVDAGRVILCGTFPAQAYMAGRGMGFEDYVVWAVSRAGWRPDVQIVHPRPRSDAFLYVKYGLAGDRRVVFVFFQEQHDQAVLRFCPGFFRRGHKLLDMLAGTTHPLSAGPEQWSELRLDRPETRLAALVEE